MSKEKPKYISRADTIAYYKKTITSLEVTLEKDMEELALIEKKPNRHLYTELFDEVGRLRLCVELDKKKIIEMKQVLEELEKKEEEDQ